MIRYENFLMDVNEAKKTDKKPKREDLSAGKMIKTMGSWDGVDLNNQLGFVVSLKEYGHILIEFLLSFNPKLNAGHKDVGKAGHCFYVPLANIVEIMDDTIASKIKNKEVISFKATANLLKIFKRMKFEPSEEYLDMSFFDVDKENMEVISYLPVKKFDGDPDTKKGRQSMKIGRILKRLKPSLTDKQVEDLAVLYRAAYKVIILGEGKNIEVVTGEDIRFWYSNKQYAPSKYGSSELWNSCMSSPATAPVFNLYCENPGRIALCIYTNEDDKLMARALVWRIDDGRVYMDRIYAISPDERQSMIEYGQKMGMVGYNFNRPSGKPMTVTMKKDWAGKDRPKNGNPYMDTMRYFCTEKGSGRYYLSDRSPSPNEATYRGV